MTGAELRAVELRRPGWGRKGYRTEEVDEFLTRAAEALDALGAGRRPGLSPEDVHDVVFRKPPFGRGRGYDEDQVDDLLDRVEAALRGGRPAGGIELNGRPLDG
ncbi:DivIVA domain-containing protein [Modestobacter roseus]|uniref:DivIVA domain-containing protein n=1 Tax=Modestobacter roseus TaxID=1181884 RepID=A0A562IML9_9ACTN|nr:DivIVA domain-containing protein [Modestobacter roseus]MQA32473.1 DivIVA domain-containing protein [Modestobacter roseus]TWH72261.1 DivIVA domain-containing protein [Modestobacter roseus]